MKLNLIDFYYVGTVLEGFLFGLYSGIFAMYVRYHGSKEESNNPKQKVVFYTLCVLYVLSVAVNAFDIAIFVTTVFNDDVDMEYRLYLAQATVFGCCDFIAQSILIYRCWVVWGYNIRVVIFPSMLASAYLVMWTTAAFLDPDSNILVLTSLTVSMTVNAVATGLIVFRLFKIFSEVKSVTTLDEKSLGFTAGRKLHSIIFVIIESGMALFAIQLARLAITATGLQTNVENDVFALIAGTHPMLNGITPTLILVRVSMRFEPYLVEGAGSLKFVAANSNPISRTGSISQSEILHIGPHDPDVIPELEMISIREERRDDDIDGSDDI